MIRYNFLHLANLGGVIVWGTILKISSNNNPTERFYFKNFVKKVIHRPDKIASIPAIPIYTLFVLQHTMYDIPIIEAMVYNNAINLRVICPVNVRDNAILVAFFLKLV